MTFLPIVEREMRVAARGHGAYAKRLRIALLATGVFAFFFTTSEFSPSTSFGKNLFWVLAGLCMIYCLLAGRLMTADCLSREKREGTLGLLFLTDLKGYDVVLGKLAATSMDGFYGLLAVFPLLAVPMLDGGMTDGELWRMALALMNTFLFSLAVGLFASAATREMQAAMGLNLGLMFVLVGLMPIAFGVIYQGILAHLGVLRPMTAPLALLFASPIATFFGCADAAYKAAPGAYWGSAGITFCWTLLFVLWACRLAPRSWQEKPIVRRATAGAKKREWRRHSWREGRPAAARAFRRQTLAVNAYCWLAGRPYLKASYVWVAVGFMGVWWVVITRGVGGVADFTNASIAILLNGLLKLWIATEAGRQLAEDKRSGAFELLLSTPLTAHDILRGQWLALRRQFLRPVLAAAALELVLMVSVRQMRAQEEREACCFWLAGILMLLADTLTAGWVGMSAALTEKNHDRATAKTAAYVLSLPWILFGIMSVITSIWRILVLRVAAEPDWPYYLAWWFGLGIALDALLLSTAKRRLENSFRQIALDSAAKKPRMIRLWAWLKGISKRKPMTRAQRRRLGLAAATVAAALAAVVISMFRAWHVPLPKPVAISISQSNNPVRVVAIMQQGFLIILPDGSLWRWIHAPRDQTAPASPPQKVDAGQWAQASAFNTNWIAVRSDGTLWGRAGITQDFKQIGLDHDWAEVQAGVNFCVARKKVGTLWAWGDNSQRQLGNGAESAPITEPAQVGRNRDWTAINAGIFSPYTLALRADGTLWIWGTIPYTPSTGGTEAVSYGFPKQVCQENDWIGFNDNGSVRNRAGESWHFSQMRGLPSPDASAAATGHLLYAAAVPPVIGPCYTTHWIEAAYAKQPDGTLWAAPRNFATVGAPMGPLFRCGHRSDWVSVWGNYETMIGLTADGTLWTWGLDSGQNRHEDLHDRWSFLKSRVAEVASGKGRRRNLDDEWGRYQPQKEPRPLMRIVVTKK
ncbi:MAG TPA: ABC transporter permease subunit [Verrucomicrobiae bacterium]|jgi:ABC-type transport system involved in cytochrome c biogenesis permease component